ncbi:MAG: hypothetical protein LH471_06315 [Salinibacterium sp.]|nr:hypothetical protein [Salinibacterium sp.]
MVENLAHFKHPGYPLTLGGTLMALVGIASINPNSNSPATYGPVSFLEMPLSRLAIPAALLGSDLLLMGWRQIKANK